MPTITKRAFFTSIIFLLILAAATHFTLRWYGAQNENQPPSGGAGTSALKNQAEPAGIKEVIYTGGGFSPRQVTAGGPDAAVCAIKILNRSSKLLTYRVGPYEKGKEKGVLYPAIAPGEDGLFDPRYTGYTELPFYDLQNPKLQFTVHYEAPCR